MEVIIKKAKELFYSYGLRSVSMDDLARESGVSKKTVYQYFEDKNAVVKAVVNELTSMHRQTCAHCSREATDAVEELVMHAAAPFSFIASINYNFFHELEKFFPQSWEQLLQYKRKMVMPSITANLERGAREGLYRNDLDTSFTAEIRLQQIRTALNPVEFSSGKAGSLRIFRELTAFYLFAITNEKGKKLIPKYLKVHHEI